MMRGLVIAGAAVLVGAALLAVVVWRTGRDPDGHRGLTQWSAAITLVVLLVAGFIPARGLWRWITNPTPNDRIVRVDDVVVGCYHVYQSPADPKRILRGDRFPGEPVVLAYDRPAQPVFNSVGLPAEFDLVLVAPDNTVYATVSLPPGVDYRQPVKPIHLVVVYARNAAPTTAHVITVGGHC